MTNIFSPLIVKDKEFRNRVVVPPMARGLATEGGTPTQKTLSHYDEISKDVALTIVEHSYISKKGKYSQNQLGIHSDRLIDKHKQISQKINQNNSLSCLQINHSGNRKTKEMKKQIDKVLDVNSLNQKEIEEIKRGFVKAASRAKKAGYDALEIHGAHGFLLNSFLSPKSNKREDKYGGSLENRLKFPLDVVDRVNKKIDDLLLLFRLGATDRDPEGMKKEEAAKIAKKLEKNEVDILDISGGLCGSRPESIQQKQGYFVPVASYIKDRINIPVIGVGGIKDPQVANEFIKKEKIDLVAIGRELLKNPKWVKEAKKRL
ncbi:oxidoreductase [archaeon SCG-AAA382B04]|nr:oxidoreductase [archaeon SCG-AAA382B04]